MPDFLFLMHDDARDASADWGPYLDTLQASGRFAGGSAMGGGLCARKHGPAPHISSHLTGYIRVRADSLDLARSLLAGNPVFEAGGTVEIRELPVTG